VAKIKGIQNHGHEQGRWEKRVCGIDDGSRRKQEWRFARAQIAANDFRYSALATYTRDGRHSLLAFDLGQVYNATFENTPTFHRMIDYSLLPLQPETYSSADRQRIIQRMAMVAIAHRAGHNLDESGPFHSIANLSPPTCANTI
jgi:hypothetical protein